MRFAYPMMLDVSHRRVLIVGGGTVAIRKACGLIDAGCCDVRAVAPRIAPDMPASVVRIERRFEAADLEDIDLVFAATDDAAANDVVIAEARSRRILVGLAGAAGSAVGDFAIPARHRAGPVTVAVAAGAPALSALIRDKIAEGFDPAWAELASAISSIRARLREQGIPQDRRRQLMRRLASTESLAIFRNAGADGLAQWLAADLIERVPTTSETIPVPAAK